MKLWPHGVQYVSGFMQLPKWLAVTPLVKIVDPLKPQSFVNSKSYGKSLRSVGSPPIKKSMPFLTSSFPNF